MTKKKGHIGSLFEDHLKEQGTLEETYAVARKRALTRTCTIAALRRHTQTYIDWLAEPGRVLMIPVTVRS